jgi:hypothetical protein
VSLLVCKAWIAIRILPVMRLTLLFLSEYSSAINGTNVYVIYAQTAQFVLGGPACIDTTSLPGTCAPTKTVTVTASATCYGTSEFFPSSFFFFPSLSLFFCLLFLLSFCFRLIPHFLSSPDPSLVLFTLEKP